MDHIILNQVSPACFVFAKQPDSGNLKLVVGVLKFYFLFPPSRETEGLICFFLLRGGVLQPLYQAEIRVDQTNAIHHQQVGRDNKQ